jgi:hypothetical protein
MKRVGGPSVPVMGSAMRPHPPGGAPAGPPPRGASPWSLPPGTGASPNRSRWPGFLLMLVGVLGLLAVIWALDEGTGISWSKTAYVELAAWVAKYPSWAPEVTADVSVLTRPTLLFLVGTTVLLGALARGGVGGGVVAGLLFIFAAAVVTTLLMSFAPPTENAAGWITAARFPSAPVFWAVLIWGRLFAVLGGGAMPLIGVLMGVIAGVGCVAVGHEAPVDAVAGVFAALAVWGAARLVVPGRR